MPSALDKIATLSVSYFSRVDTQLPAVRIESLNDLVGQEKVFQRHKQVRIAGHDAALVGRSCPLCRNLANQRYGNFSLFSRCGVGDLEIARVPGYLFSSGIKKVDFSEVVGVASGRQTGAMNPVLEPANDEHR